MDWVAKAEIDGHTLVLGNDEQWTPESDDAESKILALQANVVAAYPAYSYKESDGRPGWVAANLVKEKMGGEIELNPETDKPYYGVGKPDRKPPTKSKQLPTAKQLLSSPIYKSLIRKNAEERQAKLDDTVAQLIADNIDSDDPEAEMKAELLSEMIVAMQSSKTMQPDKE